MRVLQYLKSSLGQGILLLTTFLSFNSTITHIGLADQCHVGCLLDIYSKMVKLESFGKQRSSQGYPNH